MSIRAKATESSSSLRRRSCSDPLGECLCVQGKTLLGEPEVLRRGVEFPPLGVDENDSSMSSKWLPFPLRSAVASSSRRAIGEWEASPWARQLRPLSGSSFCLTINGFRSFGLSLIHRRGLLLLLLLLLLCGLSWLLNDGVPLLLMDGIVMAMSNVRRNL